MIDRPAREKMIRSIERYLAEEIDNHAFSNEIELLESRDPAITTAREGLYETCCDIKRHTIPRFEQYWDIYRRWMVFLRTDYQLEELYLVPGWNYPWIIRGAFAAIATLPVILFWGEGVAYLSSCFLITGVFLMAAGYKSRRDQGMALRHEHEWRPKKEWEPFLSEADWRAHESIADTMSIPPTPPPAEGDPEEGGGLAYGPLLCAFLVSWMAPAWIPLLSLCSGKWQRAAFYLRTKEPEALIRSPDSA